jgi:4-nitrophenyl phosphatase
MFDIGVLWSGDHLFPGTVETLEMLRSNGMRTPAGEKLAS